MCCVACLPTTMRSMRMMIATRSMTNLAQLHLLASAPRRYQSTTLSTRQRGMQDLFEWLYERFGKDQPLPMQKSNKNNNLVITRKPHEWTAEDLQALVHHEVVAIHIPSYLSPQVASYWATQVMEQSKTQTKNWRVSTSAGKGLESSDVRTVAHHLPYNVACQTPNGEAAYFKGVQEELRSRRHNDNSNLPPPLHPLDQFRLELDEVWPGGAGLARSPEGKVFGGGLPRLMTGPTRWPQGLIHVDELAPLSKDRGLFSANIYLQLPGYHNDPLPILDIWPLEIYSRWDWYRYAVLLSHLSTQDVEGQLRLRQALRDTITIHARPGDLILLCAQRPHAARGVSIPQATRISLQCFVQHDSRGNHGQRLLLDS